MSTSPGVMSANGRPLVDLIFFDAGGGHRASAIALKAVAEPISRLANSIDGLALRA